MIVGYGFMAHGYSKLVRGPEHFAGILHALGIPMPGFMGWVTIVIELVGGLAVLLGAFVAWVSIPLAAILLASVFTLLLPYGFLSVKLQGVTSTGVRLGTPGLRG
jgi:putative oxidoreductase